MKIKILSVLLLSVVCLTSNAQIQFGINAGVNMGKVTSKYDGKKEEGIKSAIGFIVSGDVNIPLGESLMFQTGVQFESVKSKGDDESTSNPFPGFTIKETSSNKLSLNFINIPAKIYFKMPAGGGSFMIGAGPFLGIGISGKQKGNSRIETTFGGNTTVTEDSYDEKVEYGSADTTMKRMNFGVGVNLAYVLANNMKISLFSNIGLSNLQNADKYSTKIMTFGLTLGYVFGGNGGDE